VTARIALLGGSSAFTPALASALCARSRELPGLVLVVHGRDEARCAAVARVCERHARSRGADHRYVPSTDAEEAVRGATVVVNQVRPGGFAGREHDERFPLAFDLPGDETLGPGALASALRGAPLVRSLAETSLRCAPGALFLQMSNPMSVLLGVLADLEELRVFGLCELPGDTLARALALLGLERANVDVDYAGLNHQGFFHRIERGGEDVLPALFDALAALPPGHFFRLDGPAMRALGALALPYLELVFARNVALERLRRRRPSRAAELARLAETLHEGYARDGSASLPQELGARATPWYEQSLVPALVALLGGAPAELYVSEPNRGHLAELDATAIVEKRALVDADGVLALPLATQPPPHLVAHLAAWSRQEVLAALCARNPSEAAILDALEAMPFGIDRTAARALLPHVLAPAASAP